MVPLVRDVLVLNTLPPVFVEYHSMLVPVAVRLATVPLLQKVCAEVPVGAAGALMVAVTANRAADSHPFTVCEA